MSKISSDHHRSFFAVSLYPLSFFANTPVKKEIKCESQFCIEINNEKKNQFQNIKNAYVDCRYLIHI